MATKEQLQQVAEYFEVRYGIPAKILDRMLAKESQYGLYTVNTLFPDATGFLQQRDVFAAEIKRLFGFDYNRNDPVQSLEAAAMYLAWAYRMFGSWDMAVASYNWSWPAVKGFLRAKSKGLRPKMPVETVNYIRFVAPEYAQ